MTIEQIIQLGETKVYNNSVYREELKRIYFEVFKDHLVVTCMNCVADALFRLKHYLRNNNKNKMEATNIVPCNFKMRDNQVIYIRSKHMHITNANLTDELALSLLKMNVKNITNFIKYPQNWRELLDQSNEPVPINVEKEQKNEETTTIVDEEKEEAKIDPVLETADQIVMKYKKEEIIGMLGDYPHNSTDPKYVLAALLVNKRKAVKDENHNNKTEQAAESI